MYASYAQALGIAVDTARQHWGNGVGVALSGPGFAYVNASAPWWENQATDADQEKIVAHELFHLVQHSLSRVPVDGPVDDVPQAGPRWLSEGTAEWFGWWATTRDGSSTYQAVRNMQIEVAESIDLVGLDSMETWTGYNYPGAWAIAMLAGEFLAQQHHEKLVEYFRALKPELAPRRGIAKPALPWETTFEQVFGEPSDTFYERWEEHRAAGFPPVAAP